MWGEPTEELTPRSDYPAANLSDSPNWETLVLGGGRRCNSAWRVLYYGFTVLLAVTVNIFMLLHAVHVCRSVYIGSCLAVYNGAVLSWVKSLLWTSWAKSILWTSKAQYSPHKKFAKCNVHTGLLVWSVALVSLVRQKHTFSMKGKNMHNQHTGDARCVLFNNHR